MPKEPGEPNFEEPNEELETNDKNVYVQRLEKSRGYATETQKQVQEIQSAKLGVALLRIMERSGNNPEIVNSLNDFLDALSHQSSFGDSSEDIGKGRQDDISEFLGESAKALRWTVGGGNRPAMKIDLKKWSL